MGADLVLVQPTVAPTVTGATSPNPERTGYGYEY